MLSERFSLISGVCVLFSECQVAVLSIDDGILGSGDLESRVRNSAHLLANGVLPAVLQTPLAATSSPLWRQTQQVTGAPSLPVVGSALGSSSPLEGKDLVLLVLVLSRDGQTGFAVASGVHPGANMEQWHLLVNLDTQHQMTSRDGQSSAIHLRFEYSQMRDEYLPLALHKDVHSAVTVTDIESYDGVSRKQESSTQISALPNMIRPAMGCQYPSNSFSSVACEYFTPDAHVIHGFEGMNTVRLIPDVTKPILIRSCKSTGDDPLVFEVSGLAESISVVACSRVRIVAAMVLKTVHVQASIEVELVLGGKGPQVMLSGVQGCVITLHKDTWKGEIKCLASSDVSVNAVESGKRDTLSLQNAAAVERVLLPDSMKTLVHDGRMTTQCHFTHFETEQSFPPKTLDPESPQLSALPTPQYTDPAVSLGARALLSDSSKDLARFGVGLLLRKSEDGTFQVARVAEGGAAYKDGRITAGDILTAINGNPTNSKRLRDIGEELTGPLGSEVWLSLLHSDQLRPDIKFETHIVLHRGPISPNIEEARMPPQPKVAKLSRDEAVEIFQQIDANGNGEISQIEFIQALRRDSALANRLGLPNEIRQEDESRKLFAFKYADIDKDQNKALSLGEFLAHYHGDSSLVGLHPPDLNGSAMKMHHDMSELVRSECQTLQDLKMHHEMDIARGTCSRIENEPFNRPPDVGVGIAVMAAPDGAYRVSGLVSGAAMESGQVAIGDVLHSVDGINVRFKSEQTVIGLVKGPPGSRVVLSFLLPEAQPDDLNKSVKEFNHWRPVVLTRAAVPLGDRTPPSMEEEKNLSPLPRVVVSKDRLMVRSAAPVLPAVGVEEDLPHPHGEPLGLTLYLDDDFEKVAGNEADRDALCSDIELDISTSLQTSHSRIKVVDLLPGSVLADVHIYPAVRPDQPSAERLAAEISIMTIDPQSPLRKANSTRHLLKTEIRGPISQVPSLREHWMASQPKAFNHSHGPNLSPSLPDLLSSTPSSIAAVPPLANVAVLPRANGLQLSEKNRDMSASLGDRVQRPRSPARSQSLRSAPQINLHRGIENISPTTGIPDIQHSRSPTVTRASLQPISPTFSSVDISPQPNLSRDEAVEIFKQIDANGNGEISQIEFIQALRRDSALANRLGLPNEIRQEDESRKLFAFKYADIDKDQNKALSLGEFLAYYHKDENNENSGDGPGSVSGARSADMIIKLGLDFAIAGPEDSTQREAFVCDLSQDLANASRLPPASFYIKMVSPGSIIVDTEIRADAFGNTYDPGTVARDLERQANDPSSTLRCGVLTRFTQSLVLRPPQPTPLIQLSPTKSNFERPPLPMASAKPNYVGQTSAPPLLRNSVDCMPKQKSGVGLAFKMNEFGEFVVLAIRPGSSADNSGICVGNKIVSVGPIPVKGIPRDTVVELIKGSPGTRVTLVILRQAGSHGTENGKSELVSVTLIRSDESSSSPVGSAEPMVSSSSASAAPMMETSKSETSKSSASAAPMMETSMMSLSESLSQTIAKPKNPFDFIGVPRTVTLQRGPGYTGNPDESTGVGISFQATKSGGYMIITKLVQNGPADSSREVSIGDAILRVNNVPVQGKRIPEVVSLIKGQPGSFVVLVLQPTSLDEVTLSHGGGSLYNSASSHMGSKASGPGYDTIPRAPVYSGSSTTMTSSFNSSSAPSIPAQRPSRPAGIRVVRLQRQHLNTGSGVSERAGIGMGFERDPAGNHTVSTLFPGGTAANSGKIYIGDRVLRVNGAAVQGLSPKVVSEMIQGPQGTDVAMTIETLETVQNATAAVTQSNVDSDELFVVALVLTATLPCKVSGVDMLMDKTHRLQEQEGYQNESINVGDHIIAINQKILQNQTSQQLFQMLSGPLHSEVELMVQNASCNGDKLYTVNLVRNVPIAIYSHWCEQINTPTVVHPSAHLTGPGGLLTALDDSANQPSILVEPKVEVQQTAAASNTALVPRITPPSALKLTVKVLEADGLALSEGGAVPLCVANLRLIFPDDLTESIPDVLQAMGEGQKALFGNSLHEYIAQMDKVEETQLEITFWDKNSPEDGFMGEVLLNVAKLQKILGNYLEHSFPIKTSSVYSSRSRVVTGNALVGLRMDAVPV